MDSSCHTIVSGILVICDFYLNFLRFVLCSNIWSIYEHSSQELNPWLTTQRNGYPGEWVVRATDWVPQAFGPVCLIQATLSGARSARMRRRAIGRQDYAHEEHTLPISWGREDRGLFKELLFSHNLLTTQPSPSGMNTPVLLPPWHCICKSHYERRVDGGTQR